GVLGGLLNAVVAPLVFSSLVEFPIMLVAACLLRPSEADLIGRKRAGVTLADCAWAAAAGVATALAIWLVPRFSALSPGTLMAGAIFAGPLVLFYLLQERPLRHGLALAAIFLASAAYSGIHGNVIVRLRDFYGIHRVAEKDGRRVLVHGDTIH